MFTAGYNQPGYLPEMDVEEYDTFDDAAEFLYDELDLNLSNNVDATDAAIRTNLEGLQHEIDKGRPFAYLALDGYAYWIDKVLDDD
jgi:hypothetical protein